MSVDTMIVVSLTLELVIFIFLSLTNFVSLLWAPKPWQRGTYVALGIACIVGAVVTLVALWRFGS